MLLEVVEERRRRGFVERVVRAKARRLVVDPSLLDAQPDVPTPAVLDRHAAEHLAATAGQLVRDVATMQAAAERRGQQLLTFTIEADVRVGSPADVEDLATAACRAWLRSRRASPTPPCWRPATSSRERSGS